MVSGSKYPQVRKRRLRQHPTLRRMTQEVHLHASQLILPLFVVPGSNQRQAVESMPEVFRLSVDLAAEAAAQAWSVGVPAVILFGVPEEKDEKGIHAVAAQGLIPQAVKAIKARVPQLMVITDVCLCEWLSHGHCGLVQDQRILNDETLPVLCEMALAHARAGADLVAPSDMMDGRVAAIRQRLDAAGFSQLPIMAYSAKFASSLYAPFRDAGGGAARFGDRATYQIACANGREARHEVLLDVAEGADIVMVKPALPCLDVVRSVRDAVLLPLAAYQVSGEYAMVWAAAEKGWLDLDSVMMETLLAIRRAGADLILTYFAVRAARKLMQESAS